MLEKNKRSELLSRKAVPVLRYHPVLLLFLGAWSASLQAAGTPPASPHMPVSPQEHGFSFPQEKSAKEKLNNPFFGMALRPARTGDSRTLVVEIQPGEKQGVVLWRQAEVKEGAASALANMLDKTRGDSLASQPFQEAISMFSKNYTAVLYAADEHNYRHQPLSISPNGASLCTFVRANGTLHPYELIPGRYVEWLKQQASYRSLGCMRWGTFCSFAVAFIAGMYALSHPESREVSGGIALPAVLSTVVFSVLWYCRFKHNKRTATLRNEIKQLHELNIWSCPAGIDPFAWQLMRSFFGMRGKKPLAEKWYVDAGALPLPPSYVPSLSHLFRITELLASPDSVAAGQ